MEDAVARVLRDAGLSVVELDEALGDTSSADLLVGDGSERRLVEVKSASGRANESLVAKLLGHLQTWARVAPDNPVSGGVLIVNHQHRLKPADRDVSVYQRKEFTDSLTVPVISAAQLFSWWRGQDWAAIRTAMFARVIPAVRSGHRTQRNGIRSRTGAHRPGVPEAVVPTRLKALRLGIEVTSTCSLGL